LTAAAADKGSEKPQPRVNTATKRQCEKTNRLVSYLVCIFNHLPYHMQRTKMLAIAASAR
jgi:hypothetical protein